MIGDLIGREGCGCIWDRAQKAYVTLCSAHRPCWDDISPIRDLAMRERNAAGIAAYYRKKTLRLMCADYLGAEARDFLTRHYAAKVRFARLFLAESERLRRRREGVVPLIAGPPRLSIVRAGRRP